LKNWKKIRKDNHQARLRNQHAQKQEYVSNIPLPGGDRQKEIERIKSNIDKNVDEALDRYNQANDKEKNKKKVLHKLNLKKKYEPNSPSPEIKPSKWKKDDEFTVKGDIIQEHDPTKFEPKWKKQDQTLGFLPIEKPPLSEQPVKGAFPIAKKVARRNWNLKKDTLVSKLDERTLEQVIIEEDSIDKTKIVRPVSKPTTPISSPVASPSKYRSKSGQSPFSTPKKDMKKSASLEAICKIPTPTKSTSSPPQSPVVISRSKLNTPVKCGSDSDVDSTATQTVGTTDKNADDSKSKKYSFDEMLRDIKDPKSFTEEKTVTEKDNEIELAADVRKNLIDVLAGGDNMNTQESLNLELSDGTGSEIYSADFSDTSSNFEDPNTPRSDENVVQAMTPAKPHDCDDIFEALECMRVDLENELSAEVLIKVYELLEANDDDDPPENEIRKILNEKFEVFYPKIFKLYLSDGAYLA